MTQKRASPKQTATLERTYEKELEKASLRIKANTAAWLVRFSQTPLDSLSQGELIDLGYELNCLADFRVYAGGYQWPYGGFGIALRDWKGRMRFQGKSSGKEIMQVILKGNFSRPPMDHPSLDQINHLQQFVAELITASLQEGHFSVELPPIEVLVINEDLIFVEPSEEGRKIPVLSFADCPKDLFTHNVTLLLIHPAARIRRCPNCQKVFFADRKNKLHCSSKCQNTAAVKRLRQSASDSKSKRGKIPKSSKNPKAKTLEKKGD